MVDQETHIRLGGFASELRLMAVGQQAMSNTLTIVVQDVRELRNEMADLSRFMVTLDQRMTSMEGKLDAILAKLA